MRYSIIIIELNNIKELSIMENKKNIFVNIRVKTETRELLDLMVKNAPQGNLSELIETLIFQDAVRRASFDKEIKNKLDDIIPRNHITAIANEYIRHAEDFKKKIIKKGCVEVEI